MDAYKRFSSSSFDLRDSNYDEHEIYTCNTCGALVGGNSLSQHNEWHNVTEEFIKEQGRWVKAFMEWKDLIAKGVRI